MPMAGRRTKLFLNVGTTAAPSYQAIGQSTGLSISRTRSTTQSIHKDSNEAIPSPGAISLSYTLPGFRVRGDYAQGLIETLFYGASLGQFRVQQDGAVIEQFSGYVTDFSEEHPVEGDATYNMVILPIERPFPAA